MARFNCFRGFFWLLPQPIIILFDIRNCFLGKIIMASNEKVYSETEISKKLDSDHPRWYYENGWIKRKYKTSGWKSTLMVVNLIGHMAEAAWHHPDLSISYAFVIVKLQNHEAKGITEKDFYLAKAIEDIVQWQPSKEKIVDGTPDDSRFKYIKYD